MAVVTSDPRVTASNPGAWLDGQAWVFSLTFTDPDPITGLPTTNSTDLTGSRVYVNFQAQGPLGFIPVQVCDSAANDGSLTIAPGKGGQITISASPQARQWTAPQRVGPLAALVSEVIGDVWRQMGNQDPEFFTRLTLRVLPTTGAPPSAPQPSGGTLDFSNSADSGLIPAL